MGTRRARVPDALAVGLTILALLGIWHPVTRTALPPIILLVLSGYALWCGLNALRRAGELTGIELAAAVDPGMSCRMHANPTDQQRRECGIITRGGYRSASLLVLRLRSADGRVRRIDVWRDAVSAELFSSLHLAQASAGSDQSNPASLQTAGSAALHSPATSTAGARRTEETICS